MKNQNIEEIIKEKREIEDQLMTIPGVTGVGVGYKQVNNTRIDEIAIIIYVKKKKKKSDITEGELIPELINGIKTDVIESEAFASGVIDPKKYRPFSGGASIGPDRGIDNKHYNGTLGAIVVDVCTRQKFILSNYHVLCPDDTWRNGDQIDQPSVPDGGTNQDGIATLYKGVLNDHVDAAIGSIAEFPFYASIIGIGYVKGTTKANISVPPAPPMNARKRGRTSELTYGYVYAVDITGDINYGSILGLRKMKHMVEIAPDTARNPIFSDGGDSGSVIVDDDNKIFALLLGTTTRGNGLGNPIDLVEDALGVKIYTKEFLLASHTPVSVVWTGGETLRAVYVVGQDSEVYVIPPFSGYDWARVGTKELSQQVPLIVAYANAWFICGMGKDGYAYFTTAEDAGWNNWIRIGNLKFEINTPIACINQGGSIDLYAFGIDGKVYNSFWSDVATWSDWSNDLFKNFAPFPIGTPITTLYVRADDTFLFAVAANGFVYNAHWNGVTWTGWNIIGGTFKVKTPITAICADPTNSLMFLFAIGTNGKAYYSMYTQPGYWGDFNLLGDKKFLKQNDPFIPALQAISLNASNIKLYGICTDDNLVYESSWNGATWDTIWVKVPFPVTQELVPPLTAMSQGDFEINLFAVGLDGAIYSAYWDKTWDSWFGWFYGC